ncbi:MAG: glycosyltransferase family 4 protein [Lutibacter sp.]
MNIAFLTPEYPHKKIAHSAGIGTSIRNLAKSLNKKGHKIIVFVYSQNKNEIFDDNGIMIHKIKHVNYLIGGWFFYRKYLEKYCNQIIAEQKIDLIEAPDWTGITAFMNFKIPLVIKFHGSDSYFCHLEQRKQKWKNFLFEKIALKNANYLASVSRFTADLTENIFKIKKPITIIPNGIDLQNFKPCDSEFFANQQILYFGSIIRKKGVLELAKAFNIIHQKNSSAKLLFVGNDVSDALTCQKTSQLILNCLDESAKKQVEFVGIIPYNQIKNYLNSATVVVLPSFAEAFPMTWLEAMAMQKALVTSNIGWANEIMESNKTGFMVNPKNHQLMATNILSLLENKDLNTKFGINSRKVIESKFSMDIIAEKNIDFYQNLIHDYNLS